MGILYNANKKLRDWFVEGMQHKGKILANGKGPPFLTLELTQKYGKLLKDIMSAIKDVENKSKSVMESLWRV